MFLDAPIDVRRARDATGLYRLTEEAYGSMLFFFECPSAAELTLNTFR